MFQQVVYTRCKPRRELLDVSNDKLSDGKVVNEEGLAIHNFSDGLIDPKKLYDPLYLETLMKKTNAAKEMGTNSTGIFSSYEYFYNENGDSFFGHEYVRPYDPTLIRPNGQKHRPGTHIKQYLVGTYTDYPCNYFGSSCWNAYQKSENFYYHDNNEPLEYLPAIDESCIPPTLTRKQVKEFIEDGREDCVKKLIFLVLQEMSKQIEERKFIVIKDLPKNVELWIAAVELSLPSYLANTISFSTNVVASSNLSLDNIYYVDENGKYIKGNQKDAKDNGGKKRYFSMIVGIHPLAQGSSSITFGMNNVNFIMVDGTSKSIDTDIDTSLMRNFYNAAISMDEDIDDFEKLLHELKHVEFGSSIGDLYELFDGYKYLLDSASDVNSWTYDKVKQYVSSFKKYEEKPFKWSQYLAEKVYSIYQKFYETDYENGFPLLKQIISMDHLLKLKSNIEEFLVSKYLLTVRKKNIDIKVASELNKAINNIYVNIPELVAEGIKESRTIFTENSNGWNAEQAYYVFTKLFESYNMAGKVEPEWHKEEINVQLNTKIFEIIYNDDNTSKELLEYIKNTPIYLELAISGAKKNYEKWSRFICDTVVDSKLEMLCGAMLEMDSINETQYEEFLISLLKAGKSTNILFKFLIKSNDKFGLNEKSSVNFVSAYLEQYSRHATELKALVDLMSNDDIGSSAEELAYYQIDEFISNNTVDNPMKMLAKEFEKWRHGLKKVPGRAYTIVFCDSLEGQSVEIVVENLDKYIDGEPLVMSESDMKMVIKALETNISETEVFVKLYHLVNKNSQAISILLDFDFENVEKVKWFLRVFLVKPMPQWAIEYLDDIKAIENYVYDLIKEENIDKLEKSILKSMNKNSNEFDIYKDYFSDIKTKVKEDKEEEKQRAKEAKKENKKDNVSEEKKGIFSKLFGKK